MTLTLSPLSSLVTVGYRYQYGDVQRSFTDTVSLQSKSKVEDKIISWNLDVVNSIIGGSSTVETDLCRRIDIIRG